MKPTLQSKRRAPLERIQDAVSRPNLKQARKQAGKTANKVEPYAASARHAVAHRAEDARQWAAPRLEQAAETVQHDIGPRVSSALTTAAERSAPAREEALERSNAALSALRGEVPPQQKRRRWPVAMLFFFIGGALGAVGGVVAGRFGTSTTQADPWRDSTSAHLDAGGTTASGRHSSDVSSADPGTSQE